MRLEFLSSTLKRIYNINFSFKNRMNSVIQLLTHYGLYLVRSCSRGIKNFSSKHNLITLCIYTRYLPVIVNFLKQHTNTQYQTLIDLIVVDYPTRYKRFEVIYVLLSTFRNTRICIQCSLSSLEPLYSITSYYSAAAWFEREAWDLFGIFFINNFDLRRILTDYGFDGHPFRKDFPLSGYIELRYDENQKRIISEVVEISQEYRNFDFL